MKVLKFLSPKISKKELPIDNSSRVSTTKWNDNCRHSIRAQQCSTSHNDSEFCKTGVYLRLFALYTKRTYLKMLKKLFFCYERQMWTPWFSGFLIISVWLLIIFNHCLPFEPEGKNKGTIITSRINFAYSRNAFWKVVIKK